MRAAPAEEPRVESAADLPAISERTEPLREASVGARRGALPTTRLSAAALRRAAPLRMWGGKGSGLPCDFCRVLVGPEDVEYEVEAELDGAVVMLKFHYRCHYAWTGGEEPRVAADRA
jgi:hypothetical protein